MRVMRSASLSSRRTGKVRMHCHMQSYHSNHTYRQSVKQLGTGNSVRPGKPDGTMICARISREDICWPAYAEYAQ
eukprot:scaffold492723_cov22-Prasinocladus_malaysianus.AAC.1